MGKGLATRIGLLLLAVAMVVAFFALHLDRYLTLDELKARRGELSAWIAANYVLAILLYAAIYIAVTSLPLPGAAVLTLTGGALFGLAVGLPVVSVCSTISATLAFLSSRYLFRDAVQRRFARQLAPIENGVLRDGAVYLAGLRLVPAFPFFLVNLLMGLTPIRTWTYAWVSQLTMLPGTIAYVYAGTQLAKVDSLKSVISPGMLAAFALLGVLPLATKRLSGWLAARRVLARFRRPARYDYNLIAIGAGSAGLVSAYIGAAVKAKVALIERHRMGGDCLNTGCVPSKALIRSARLLAEARDSRRYGIDRMEASVDFAALMDRVQQVIAKVEPHDSVERYRGLGVDVIEGDAKIVSPWEVEVGGRRISARNLIVATGARPLVPDLPGLAEVGYLTSDSLWSLRDLPKRLVVLGGGPIGCELAQCFARFGAAVSLVEMAPRLLPREDGEAAALVAEQFAAEGLTVAVGHRALRVEKDGDGGVLVCDHGGAERRFPFDRLLLALGRRANVSGFGLEELGVAIRPNGTIDADGRLRTTVPSISVCGDVTGPYQFTHVSAHQAWYAAVNALLAPFWSFKVDYRVIPWCTYTEPEVARVGLSEDEAAAQDIAVEVTRYGIDDLDRAIADGSDHGFVKVLTAPGKDRVLGATVVGPHAGELLATWVLAMKHGLGLDQILGTIHAYPTLMEANKYAAGAWKRAHAPAGALRWAERYFAWRRG